MTRTTLPAPSESPASGAHAPPLPLPGPGEPGLVSVVIPTYDRSDLLRQAVESVLDQTYRPVEILVVDDGSTDDTPEVVAAYGPPVRYIRQENAGVSAARNRGMRHARGEFVALLDSDDAWDPWKLEAQIALLRAHPEMGMTWSDMRAVNPEGEVVSPTYLRTMYGAYREVTIDRVLERRGSLGRYDPECPPGAETAPVYVGDLFPFMILGNLVHTSTVVIRRDRLRKTGGFDERRRTGEDYEFHLRTTYQGPVGLLDTPTIRYRIGAADQLSAPHRHLEMAESNLETLSRWLPVARERNELPPDAIRRRVAGAHTWRIGAELDAGRLGDARREGRFTRDQLPLLLKSLLPVGVRSALSRIRSGLRRVVGSS